MIKTLTVLGLHNKDDYELRFNPDLNVLTGRNGSGKTTLLKLLWYLISGNLERIPTEILLREATIETDLYTASVRVERTKPLMLTRWTLETPNGPKIELEREGPEINVDELNIIVAQDSSSLFFPTFRRIEGGFSMGATSSPRFDRHGTYIRSAELESAINALARTLTVFQHRFIAAISTQDIVESLTAEYANISEKINTNHTRLSMRISHLINALDVKPAPSTAESALQNVMELVEGNTNEQKRILRPFEALGELITQIFQHKGIKVTERVTLGETTDAISSDLLSAGEKQMLSFLAYNAFRSKSTIFIDEPEISLHVDWQRILFPTLLSQGTDNQFIVATHSPFIYSRYADKELALTTDRGN